MMNFCDRVIWLDHGVVRAEGGSEACLWKSTLRFSINSTPGDRRKLLTPMSSH